MSTLDAPNGRANANPQVSVCVVAYNHERYVAQCLESILAQETTFEFEVIARDDASTDDTASVLREYARQYPEKVRLVLEPRNTYGDPAYKPLFGRVFAPIARGRYLATCEGDDYWTSSTKLQRQFEYMETHASCVLCCHATRIVREDGGSSSKLLTFGSEDRDVTCDEIMRGWAEDRGFGITSLHPSSWFSRRLTDLDYAASWHIEASMGDFMRACYFAHIAPVHFFAEPMSAYRYLARESWTTAAESNADVLAQHYAEYLRVTQEIDSLTGFEYHNSAMVGSKQRALLLAGMTSGFEFFKSELGRPIAQYLTLGDRMTLIALRTLNALGLRPARNTATGRITLRRLR